MGGAPKQKKKFQPKIQRRISKYNTTIPQATGKVLHFTQQIPIDHDQILQVDFLKLSSIPALYIDGTSIMVEVDDLTTLRHADHLFSSINPMLGKSYYTDLFMSYVSHFGLWPFYHHYVVMEDVAMVDEKGIPRTASGKEVEIAEYSGTPEEAVETLQNEGLMALLGNLAQFRRNPLIAYFATGCRGVFKIDEDLTNRERREVVKNAEQLMGSGYPNYSPIFSNCEHAIWSLNPGRSSWQSPQVPFFFRNLLQLMFMLVGTWFLTFQTTSTWLIFHTLTTLTCVVRVLLDLSTKITRLTEHRSMYGWEVYNFLIHRQVARSAFALLCFVITQYKYSIFVSTRTCYSWWIVETSLLFAFAFILVFNFYFWRMFSLIVIRLIFEFSLFCAGGVPVFTVRSIRQELTMEEYFSATSTNLHEELDSPFKMARTSSFAASSPWAKASLADLLDPTYSERLLIPGNETSEVSEK